MMIYIESIVPQPISYILCAAIPGRQLLNKLGFGCCRALVWWPPNLVGHSSLAAGKLQFGGCQTPACK